MKSPIPIPNLADWMDRGWILCNPKRKKSDKKGKKYYPRMDIKDLAKKMAGTKNKEEGGGNMRIMINAVWKKASVFHPGEISTDKIKYPFIDNISCERTEKTDKRSRIHFSYRDEAFL